MTIQSTTRHVSMRGGYFITGTLGLLLAIAYLYLSREYTFGTMDQPGARVWPTVVGLLVVIASLCVLWEGWQMPRDATFELPAGADAMRVVYMIGLLVIYFVLMDVIGQFLASTLFCVFFMRLISPLSWPRLIAVSLGITISLYLIFITVLKIPMPKGLLG